MVWQIVMTVVVLGVIVPLPSWALHRAFRWGIRRVRGADVGVLVTAIPSVVAVGGGVAFMALSLVSAPLSDKFEEVTNQRVRFPPLAPAREPGRNPFAAVEAALDNLATSHAEYLAPQTMEIGRPQTVTLELGPAQQVVDDIARLQAEKGGQVGGDEVRTAPLMRAELTGNGFEFDPKGPVDQWVSLTTPTSWKWAVTAVDADDWFPHLSTTRQLSLSLSAVFSIQGSEHPRGIKTWEKTITVDVGLPTWLHKAVEFAKDIWWVFLLLAALIGYVLHRKPWPKPEES